MKELRRDGRALLDEARRERTPDAAIRERVYSELLASAALAAGSPAEPPGRPRFVGARKWLLLGVLAAAVAGALYLAGHARTKSKSTPHPASSAASARRPG